MMNVCGKCGKPLSDNARFCRFCGFGQVNTVQKPDEKTKFCVFCGNRMSVNAKFCANCGKSVSSAPKTANNGTPVQPVKQNNESVRQPSAQPADRHEPSAVTDSHLFRDSEQRFIAPAAAGEVMLGRLNMFRRLTPGALIISRLKEFPNKLLSFLKDPKKLVPVIVMCVIWFVTYFLRAFGNNSVFTKLLSFISFSGRPTANPLYLTGALIGRGVFAGAVVSLIAMIFSKKSDKGVYNGPEDSDKRQAFQKRSVATMLTGCFGVDTGSMWGYLFGIGAAFAGSLFISGGGGFEMMLGSVSAAFLLCRATLNNGFLRQFISAVSYRLGKGDAKKESSDSTALCGVMRGMAVGFAASSLICIIPFSNLLLTGFGIILILIGGMMTALQLAGIIKSVEKGASEA